MILSSPTPKRSRHFRRPIDQFLSSDHFPILLSSTSYVPLPNPPRWCFDRADWGTFTSLSHISLPPSTFSSTSELLTFFTVSILSAALAAIPRTTRSYNSKCVPWWNPDLLKPFVLNVPPGALTATAGTSCTKCQPLFPSNEPPLSLSALRIAYVSQLPKAGKRMFPPLPRIHPFLQFGIKSINFLGNTLLLFLLLLLLIILLLLLFFFWHFCFLRSSHRAEAKCQKHRLFGGSRGSTGAIEQDTEIRL